MTAHADTLGPELEAALEAHGYHTLTAVQEAVLDPKFDGRDLRVSSQTGSGKTLAIGFLLRSLLEGSAPSPRALVVVPTRELARQVETELGWLFAKTKLTLAVVTGGSPAYLERRALARNPSIVVGTPGRLLDHLRGNVIVPDAIETVVLDEADRMLDLGFREDLESIFDAVPETRRTVLVSATFAAEVARLADRVQKGAITVEGTKLGVANADIDHVVHIVPEQNQLDVIINLLLSDTSDKTLIFARTRADVGGLTKALHEAGFKVDSLSGDMEQPARLRALAAFKDGRLSAMVATDVAARGIDVVDITRVIQVDLPEDADTYTHRSGRTGRAGRKGESVILTPPSSYRRAMRILREARVKVDVRPPPGPDAIRAQEEDRLLADLTRGLPKRGAVGGDGDGQGNGEHDHDFDHDHDRDLDRDHEKPAPVSARAQAFTDRLLEVAEPREILARFVEKVLQSNGPSARNVPTIMPPRDPRDGRDAPGTGGPPQTFVPFRISMGREHGADARRILAIVCRRGNIQGKDVGPISIARAYSVVGVAAYVANQFADAAAIPDEANPKLRIKREEGILPDVRPDVVRAPLPFVPPAFAGAPPRRPLVAGPAPRSRPRVESVEYVDRSDRTRVAAGHPNPVTRSGKGPPKRAPGGAAPARAPKK